MIKFLFAFVLIFGAIGLVVGSGHKKSTAASPTPLLSDNGPVTITQERGHSYTDLQFTHMLATESAKHATNFATMCREIRGGGTGLLNPGMQGAPAISDADLIGKLDFRSRDFSTLATVITDVFGFPAKDPTDAFYGSASNIHALTLVKAYCA